MVGLVRPDAGRTHPACVHCTHASHTRFGSLPYLILLLPPACVVGAGYDEEVFGPVLAIVTVDTLDEAIQVSGACWCRSQC